MNQPVISVEGDEVDIRAFTVTNGDLARLLDDADDRAGSLERVLSIGTDCVRVARSGIDTAVLDRAVVDVRTSVDRAVSDLSGIGAQWFDPEKGKVTEIVDRAIADIDRHLADRFDPDSKKGVIGVLGEVLHEVAGRVQRTIVHDLDPSIEGTVGHRLSTEVARDLVAGITRVEGLVQTVQLQLAAEQGRQAEAERGTAKGVAFEDQLEELVVEAALPHQDVVENVSTVKGATGAKTGDLLVTLDPRATRGHAVRVVIECKDKALRQRQALDEIDAAIANRQAQVGIMTFASQGQAPIPGPFAVFGNRAIVVVDKTNPDPRVVSLIHGWARATALAAMADSEVEVDLAKIAALLDQALAALTAEVAIKQSLGGARNQLDAASKHVTGLVSAVRDALTALAAELGTAHDQAA